MLASRRLASRATCFLIAAGMLLSASALLVGCGAPARGPDDAERSAELTPGQFPEKRPTAATPPPPPQLREPRTAVYSYLLWISYAYRILDSDVASATFSPNEEVRVNSYVQLNRQEGRAIDQRLVGFEVKDTVSEGETATVGVTETWRYRYIDIKDGDYKTPAYDVSYETTYTVVKQDANRWVVEKVEIGSTSGEVK